MSKKANNFLVGIFVLGAVALFTVGLLLFGAGRVGEDTKQVVAFFDGSVKGLRIGATVSFRGVKIGEVADVQLRLNHANKEILIPVMMEIFPEKVIDIGERPDDDREAIERMIDRGLRAQLDMESFVTGILAVDLDYHEGAEKRLIGPQGLAKGYIEIPTIPSAIEKFSSALEKLPLAELVEEIRKIVKRIGDLLESENTGTLTKVMDETLKEFSETLKSARKLIKNVDGEIAPVSQDLRSALTESRRALKQIEKTFAETSEIFADDSDSRYELRELVKSLRGASEKVKDLADYLERNPDALIRGKRGAE